MFVKYVLFFLCKQKISYKHWILHAFYKDIYIWRTKWNYLNKAFMMSPVTSLVPIHYQAPVNLLLGSLAFHSSPKHASWIHFVFSFCSTFSSGSVRTEHSSNSGFRVKVSAHVLIADSAFHVLLSETDTSYLHQLPTVCFFTELICWKLCLSRPVC